MTELADKYSIENALATSSLFDLYKARDLETGKDITLKIGKDNTLTAQAVLRNEQRILNLISGTNFRNALSLTRLDEKPCLVMNYIPGVVITHETFINLPLAEKVKSLLALMDSLQFLQSKNILHLDLNPSNILFNPENHSLHIIDFGSSVETSASKPWVELPNNLYVDFGYISPELTGRLNRNIDVRSDIYSLGMVLYHIFSKKPPYDAADPISLVYNHIAVPLEELIKTAPDIPEMLSQIVMKMVEKSSEDRYQSWLGVRQDFHSLLQALESNQWPAHFETGKYDSHAIFSTPDGLFGRANESKQLSFQLENVLGGNAAFAFISGKKGSGKTSLVKELLKPLSKNKLQLSTGSADANTQKSPYQLLINTLESLFQWYLTVDEHALHSLKKRVVEMNGNNLGLITGLVPTAALLFGEQPLVEKIPALESANRLSRAFINFIQSLASPEIPIVLFFDNLHQADQRTIELISELAHEPNLNFTYVISAFENSENPVWAENLGIIKNIIESNNTSITKIDLVDLSAEEVQHLISENFTLLEKRDAQTLSELLYKNSKGNPGMLFDFIHTILSNGIVTYNADTNKCTVDLEAINNFKVSEDFRELISARISELDPKIRELLAKAAILGNQFHLDSLISISELEADEVSILLEQAINEFIIAPVDYNLGLLNNTSAPQNGDKNLLLSFVREEYIAELLDELNPKSLQDLHWKAGLLLIEKASENESDPAILDITNHLNYCKNRANNADDKALLARYNLVSARRIKGASGWELALEFYNNIEQLAPENIFDSTEYADFLYEQAECAYLAGKLEQANSVIEKIENLASTPLEKAKINALKLSLQINFGNFSAAKESGFQALKELGIKPPGPMVKIDLVFLLLKLHLKLRNKKPDYYYQLPEMTEEKGLLAAAIIEKLATVLFNERFELIVYTYLKFFQYSLKRGNSPYCQIGFGIWGNLQSILFKNYSKGWETLNVGSNIVQRYNSPYFNGKNEFALGFMAPLTQNINVAIGYLQNAYNISTKAGDYLTAAHASISLISDKFYASKSVDEIISESKQFLTFSKSFNYGDAVLYHSLMIEFLDYLRNAEKSENPEILFKNIQNDLDNTPYTFIRTVSNLLRAIAWTYVGKPERALEFIVAAKTESQFLIGTMAAPLLHFYSAIIIWKQNQWSKHKFAFRKHLNELSKMEMGKSNNTNHLLLTVSAIFDYENENKFECIEKLKRAETFAEEFHFTRELAFISELLGDVFTKEGFTSWARLQYSKAAQYYEDWGYERKEQNQMLKTNSNETKPSNSQFMGSSSANIDLLTSIKLSEAISGEVQLQPMATNLLSLLIENAGADYGCILLEKSGEYVPFADGEIINGNLKVEIAKAPISRIHQPFVRYAVRTGKTVVLDDAMASPLFSSAPISGSQGNILSVFCHPVISKGKNIAVIYLENNHLKGAFSSERTHFMELLSGQISISLENSILYENLEQKVAERTVEISKQKAEVEIQKKKSDDLLLNILPEEVAEELKLTGKASARLHPEASVMFMDIISFTQHAETISPSQLVNSLDDFFGRIDKIIGKYGIEKIKTIGDAYLCASGIPIADPQHAEKLILAALEIIESEKEFNENRVLNGNPPFNFRIGIHSGPVVSGVVGSRKFAYDIWGDTVNTASRMESKSEAGKINISGTTYALIKEKFECTARGELEAKNKGFIEMYFVDKVKH